MVNHFGMEIMQKIVLLLVKITGTLETYASIRIKTNLNADSSLDY